MTPMSRLFLVASIGALAACGSSRTPAPVVYGSQPQYAYGQAAYQPPRTPYGQTYAQAPYAQPAAYAPTAYSAPYYPAPTYAAPGYGAPQPPREQLYATPTYTPAANAARLTPVSMERLDPPAPEYQRIAQTYPQPPAYQPQPASASYQPAQSGWVTVQPGDTVYAIARRTGQRPQAIIAENNLYPPYALNVGQSIRLPGAPGYAPGAGYNPGSGYQPQPQPISYPQNTTRIVRMGETLYSVSRSTGVPVQRLADANRLYPPYALQVGQSLIIPNARGDSYQPAGGYQQPGRNPTSVDVADLARSISYTSPKSPTSQRLFDWPVRGAVIGSYGAGAKGRRNDGVNIAAPVGTPVRAAADGEVVYRGSELDGYGNLLLVKHRDGFVTAYAHNDVMLVKKGQKVEQGQVIAKVGQTGAVSEPQLHFEIRQDLKSVDPLAFLQ